MKIPIHHITERGYHQVCQDESWLREAAQKAIEGDIVDVFADFSLKRVEQRVSVGLSYRLRAKKACMRCVYLIGLHLEHHQILHYDPIPEDGGAGEEELELLDVDLDIGWYEEGKIDLAIVVCEAMTLALPMVIHCSSDFVVEKNPDGCLQENKIEERTLENLFVDLFKTQ